MEIKGKVHCFFEQSGTFKNEFIKLGISGSGGETILPTRQTPDVGKTARQGGHPLRGIQRDAPPQIVREGIFPL